METLNLSIYITIYLSIFLSFYLSFYLSIYISIYLSIYICIEGKDRVEPLSGMVKAMTKKMTESLMIPHFGYYDEINMSNLVTVRKVYLKGMFMVFLVNLNVTRFTTPPLAHFWIKIFFFKRCSINCKLPKH